MYTEDLDEARLAVADRLTDIEAGLARLPTNDLKQQVHSLKGLAAAYGLIVIESLCHSLEQRLENGRDDTAVLAYIDRMNEAAEDDRMDDASAIPALEAEIARHLQEA